ncbi:hypothetical protein EAW52_04930 [Pseudomonas sp. LTJR-52]|nr:hypothetical protein EAW52_04930 [Pseudomonas sp. LTJR-52]
MLAEPFLAFPLRAIRSVIPSYQCVASLQDRRLDEPLVEGIADQPFPWRPHLDDGDSCQLQMAAKIHFIIGMGSEYLGRVASISCPLAGIPIKVQPAWEIPLDQTDTSETTHVPVLLCAACKKMLDLDNDSNVVVLRNTGYVEAKAITHYGICIELTLKEKLKPRSVASANRGLRKFNPAPVAA